MADKIKIILDTDIADDIDDANCLAFILGSPEFELLGVTVVYGDVDTRAKVARKLCRAWGRDDVPIHMGYERPMGYDWFAGTAPESPPSQYGAIKDEPPLENPRRSAVEFISQTVRKYPGQVHVLTIGAMTNVGLALCAEPELAGLMAGVRSEAGGVPPYKLGLDWNVAYDVLAARAIAHSGVKWTCIGGSVMGVGNGLAREEFDALEASGLESARVLLDLTVHMKRHKKGQDPTVRTIKDVKSSSVCDVMTPASFLVPERMDFRRGRIEANLAVGCLEITPDDGGPHVYAGKRLAEGSYRKEILRRLLAEQQARVGETTT